MDCKSPKSCRARHCRKRRESVRRRPIGGLFRKCSAATKSLPESALGGRVLPLHRPPFVPCAPALCPSSFPASSAETWTDLLHEASSQKEADQQSREPNCDSYP